ncbi:hypothetical protein SERLA73DRAFT_68444 [Serpula lacrymans var. lacrymans S7.3]|uniref:Uncharacterized protein n=1 Tax=Serpula lacrymans var. lacrymans (strain S7.3) TaxID=936435 RepID=F8PFW4_SERL3|nr:hypothetical protein SERLA73DRAFT_68444 [Serpula lacrymans var. lacrymans S7.3]
MSEPQRMQTRAKNATQRPGLHLLEAQAEQNPVKRRTKAEKAADDQHEKDSKEAKAAAIQDSYKHIAVLQEQMQVTQQNAHADAPKSRRPCPCPHQVKHISDASGSKAANEGNTAADSIVVKGVQKGHEGQAKGKCAADVAQLASDEEEEIPAPAKSKLKKALKTAVRDAIEAVSDAVDGTVQAHISHGNTDAVPTPAHLKFQLAGRIQGWGAGIPATGVKPLSKYAKSTSSASSFVPQTMSSIATLSTAPSIVSRGSTVSSCPPPPTPVNSPFPGDDIVMSGTSGPFNNAMDDSVEREAALACTSKGKGVLIAVNTSLLDNTDGVDSMDVADVGDQIENNITSSESDIEADSNDMDLTPPLHPVDGNNADLMPPHSTQVPMAQAPARSAVKLHRKVTDPLNSESKVKIMENIDEFKAVIKSEPLTQHVTSSTDIAVMMKAPAAKRLKLHLSTIANDGSNSSIDTTASMSDVSGLSVNTKNAMVNTQVTILPRSQYRMRHLPEGCQAFSKWSGEVIPTVILCVGDEDEFWNLNENTLCTKLQ